MLYITTRGNKDAFTAYHALTENRAADGGSYIPFQMPNYSAEELSGLKDKSFGQVIADVLNHFFASRLTGWDVECCIGRTAFKLNTVNHKIQIAELWHNPQNAYKYIVDSLYNKIVPAGKSQASEWFCVAVRIAVLFGLYSQLVKQETLSDGESFDVCVAVDDFSGIMATCYTRSMGLPVQKIICTELENSCLWDLVQRGTFSTWLGRHMRNGIEQILQAFFGFSVADSFCNKCDQKQIFTLDEMQRKVLQELFFCSVVSKTRINSIINSVYRSNNYILDPHTALCHGGLQDFRSKTGASRTTLLFADETPMKSIAQISNATCVDAEALTDRIRLS